MGFRVIRRVRDGNTDYRHLQLLLYVLLDCEELHMNHRQFWAYEGADSGHWGPSCSSLTVVPNMVPNKEPVSIESCRKY